MVDLLPSDLGMWDLMRHLECVFECIRGWHEVERSSSGCQDFVCPRMLFLATAPLNEQSHHFPATIYHHDLWHPPAIIIIIISSIFLTTLIIILIIIRIIIVAMTITIIIISITYIFMSSSSSSNYHTEY